MFKRIIGLLCLVFLLFSDAFAAVSVYMRATSTESGSAGTEIKMASCMIMVVPTVLIFILFKDKLMGNLSMGGIKG